MRKLTPRVRATLYRDSSKHDLTFLAGVVRSDQYNGVVYVSCLCDYDQSYEGGKERNTNTLST